MHLILYTRPNCLLCDRLEQLMADHLESHGWSLTKHNIDENERWQKLYLHRIPVVACNDKIILEGRPTPEQVNQALHQLK